jgi:VanZ family protein
MLSPKLSAVTFAIICVILHGSLYPYDFHVPPGSGSPIATLLNSWKAPPSSYGDLMANLLLYVPLGFFGALAVHGRSAIRAPIVIAAGLLLSVGVELSQFYDVGRVTNFSDVYLNTGGTALGAFAALIYEHAQPRIPISRPILTPIPFMLLAAMLGYHLFPYVPTIDLHKYWHSLRPLLLEPSLAPRAVLRYTALWLTTSYILCSILGYSQSRILIPLFIAVVFAAKVVIESLVLSLPEVLGAFFGFVIWLVVGKSQRWGVIAAAMVLFIAIVVERLAPFQFGETARAFGWLPFRSFLGGSIAVNTASFLEKFFFYGSMIWFLTLAGVRLSIAAITVALVLFITSFAETYLPDRSAEITDAIMALIIGFVIAAVRTRADDTTKTRRAPISEQHPSVLH